MIVKILGTGCKKCEMLENKIKELAKEINVEATFEKVTDLNKIIEYGIMITPGLVIDEIVKSSGIIPKDDQIINWLKGED